MTDYEDLDWTADRTRGAKARAQAPVPQPDTSFLSGLGDLALAPVRGVEGAIQDTYGLLDTIAGDFLPDYKERLLGESDTLAGSIVEGISNFAAGFIPVAGWLGKAGKVGKILNLTAEAENALRVAGKLNQARLLSAGRAAVAGAITDFTVFDGHESRLSNLLQQAPALANPVSEFLAADPNDGEIEGRLKATIEGLGLGLVTDGLVAGVKALRAARRARALPGATPETVQAAVDAAMSPEQIEASLRGSMAQHDELLTHAIVDDFIEPREQLAFVAGYKGRPAARGGEHLIQRLISEQSRADSAARKIERMPGSAKPADYDRANTRPSDHDISTISDFIRRVGTHVFDDVAISIRKGVGGEGAASAGGTYTFARELIELSRPAIQNGELKWTMLHELWHSLSRFVGTKATRNIERAYAAEKAAYLKANPDFVDVLRKDKGFTPGENGNYRFRNIDEWFAETLTQHSLDRLEQYETIAGGGLRGFFAYAKLLWGDIVDGVRVKFGASPARQLVRDFLEQRVDVGVTHNPFGLGPSLGLPDRRSTPSPGGNRFEFVGDERGADAAMARLGATDEKIGRVKDALEHREELNANFDPGAGIPHQDPNAVNPRKLTPTERLELELSKGDLNLSRYAVQDGSLSITRAFEDLFDDAWRREQPGLKSMTLEEQQLRVNKNIGDLADAAGATDKRTLLVAIQNQLPVDQRDIGRINARVLAGKSAIASLSEELFQKLPKEGQALTDAQRLEISMLVSTLADVTANVKGIIAEQARGLGSHRLTTRNMNGLLAMLSDTKAQQRAIDSLGGRDNLDKVIEQFRVAYGEGGLSGVAAVSKLAQLTRTQRFVNIGTEYWMNAILSGPRTAIVNGLSGFAMSLYRPLEAMLGASVAGAANKVRGNNVAASAYAGHIAEAFRELTALAHAVPEALHFAKMAAKNGGENILDPMSRIKDVGPKERAISARSFNVAADSTAGKAINFIGTVVNIPSTVLGSTDEFFKQLNYRAVARGEFMGDAVKAGYFLPAEDYGRFVADRMDALIYKGQAYSQAQVFNRGLDVAKARGIKSPAAAEEFARAFAAENFDPKLSALSEKATRYAQDVTLTTPLDPSGFSAKWQRMVFAHPTLRFFTPFIRTPVNILKFGGQRFDAPGAAKSLAAKRFPEYATSLKTSQNRMVQDMLSGDRRRKADAIGRLAAGFSFGAWGISMAAQGSITGRGPSDPEQRRLLQNAGWQPYSFKVGDAYISYARLDPFATVLGTFADLYDYGRFAGVEDQEDADSLMHGLAVALANNFTNKSYLTGIGTLVETLHEPDKRVPTFLNRYAGSFVPNALGQGTDVTDQSVRDVRSMLDAMMARIPGLSETLPPQRNVLGEPIRKSQALGSDTIGSITNLIVPISYSEVSDQTIYQELAKLGHGFTPPKRVQGGLDLSVYTSPDGRNAFDRWGELHGVVKLNGRTLQQSLLKLIGSASYQKLSDVSTPQAESPRIGLVSSLIQDYRRAAYRQVLREYPELKRDERAVLNQRASVRRGQPNSFLSFGQ